MTALRDVDYPLDECPYCSCDDVPDWDLKDFEIYLWACPACGAKFRIEKETVYRQQNISSGMVKSLEEVDEYFEPKLKEERLKREAKEAEAEMTPLELLKHKGNKQKNKITNYFLKK
jgi:transcription elongation factor Elf1